jgi:STE24 endopeptidase
MMDKTILYIIIVILVFDYILERWLDYLNSKSFSDTIPETLKGIYDSEKYKKAQQYERAKKKLSTIASTFSFAIMLIVLLMGGFGWVNDKVLYYTSDPVWSCLVFFALLGVLSDILGLPFSIYSTFVIEEKFGFNKTTAATFIIDKLKGDILGALLGGSLLALFVLFYQKVGESFWIYMLLVMAAFMLLMTMFYSSWILPLFNKLTPLPEGNLRTAIENFCSKANFKLDNLFVMNGSKRSTKANAFFSGLGRKKKIVLFDTLVNNYTEEEVVAVLAHEIGHYKKKHTRTGLLFSLLQMTLMLFLLSKFIASPALSAALGSEKVYIQLGMLAFALVYSPVSMITGILTNILSRKHEFEADAYARETFGASHLISALKRLSVDSLSNLQPHKLYVFFYYSHPPLLERVKAMQD